MSLFAFNLIPRLHCTTTDCQASAIDWLCSAEQGEGLGAESVLEELMTSFKSQLNVQECVTNKCHSAQNTVQRFI